MSSSEFDIRETTSGVQFTVRVKPRAAQSRIVGWNDGVLDVRVAAPPAEGAANDQLERLLAKALKVGRSRITLISGRSSRRKRLEVVGLDRATLERLLATL